MLSDIISKLFYNIWPMLVVFITALGLLRFFYLKNHRERFYFYKDFSYLITIIYFLLLFEILTMNELNMIAGVNLIPFSEISRYPFGSTMFNYNVFGNIILFIPFGYIIGLYVKPKKIFPVIITTFITSVVIEFVQLKIGRSFDIDDILLNVIGGVVGYLLFIGLMAILKRLPDFFRSKLFYNLLCLVFIGIILIYVFGYWSVLFK